MKFIRLYLPCGLVLFAAFTFSSCRPENLKEGAAKEYFDIKGYFERSAVQLNSKRISVHKTVVHNGKSETRNVVINKWESELSLFTESDINKPAWKESYAKKDSAGSSVYTAIDLDLKTREIIVSRTNDGSIREIFIRNQVDNALYATQETLTYIPDSVYVINKYQKVRLLGANSYKITGRLINDGR